MSARSSAALARAASSSSQNCWPDSDGLCPPTGAILLSGFPPFSQAAALITPSAGMLCRHSSGSAVAGELLQQAQHRLLVRWSWEAPCSGSSAAGATSMHVAQQPVSGEPHAGCCPKAGVLRRRQCAALSFGWDLALRSNPCTRLSCRARQQARKPAPSPGTRGPPAAGALTSEPARQRDRPHPH